MGKAIGQILPYAVAASITVSAIIGIILILVTPKAKTNGTAFAVGYVLGFALVGTIAIVLAGGNAASPGQDAAASRPWRERRWAARRSGLVRRPAECSIRAGAQTQDNSEVAATPFDGPSFAWRMRH
jgi:hypothetical protein